MFRYSEDILVLGHSRHLDRIPVEKPRDKTVFFAVLGCLEKFDKLQRLG